MGKTDMNIFDETRDYWTWRAPSFSEINRHELETESHKKWQHALKEMISAHYPGAAENEIKVLEIGTGPGFFAVILEEAGYQVTAIDMTPAMLEEARKNAGEGSSIRFVEMNAEKLMFPDGCFDVIVSRNLTWNLPHPEQAYGEWCRVLKGNGLLLIFDANWYRYLFNKEALEGWNNDKATAAAKGIEDEPVRDKFYIMEDIARRIPLSGIMRPEWDKKTLCDMGLSVEVFPDIWKTVWSEEEKIRHASTPLFLVKACKPEEFEKET